MLNDFCEHSPTLQGYISESLRNHSIWRILKTLHFEVLTHAPNQRHAIPQLKIVGLVGLGNWKIEKVVESNISTLDYIYSF